MREWRQVWCVYVLRVKEERGRQNGGERWRGGRYVCSGEEKGEGVTKRVEARESMRAK